MGNNDATFATQTAVTERFVSQTPREVMHLTAQPPSALVLHCDIDFLFWLTAKDTKLPFSFQFFYHSRLLLFVHSKPRELVSLTKD